METFLIRKFDSYNNGYNSTLGGHSKRGYTFSEEFKEKCRNRKHSLETRRKMSISAKGRKASPDTILKLRKSLHSNLSQSQISRLCSGRRKTTTNQVWKYK